MKDFRFLLIASLGTITLAILNYPSVIKGLGSVKFANTELKQAARQVKIEGIRKTEIEFWNDIKKIESDDSSKKTEDNNVVKTVPLQQVEQPNVELAELKQQQKPLNRFLLVGDSIMYAFGVEFRNAAKKSDFKFDEIKVDFKISTGLNRVDFFDWYARTTQLVSKYNPDGVVVLFGGNDDQAILDTDGKFRAELTPEWKAAYQERVERYAKLLNESSVRKVYWVGHPISNVPRYRQFFGIFNEIYQKVSQTYPKIDFVDNWDTFAINDNFSPIVANKSGKKGRVRTKDGYHFTHHGARILADNLIQKMNQDGVLKNTVELKAENANPANNK